MKKILFGLSFLFIFGCMNKTDKNGFYIEGKNIGVHKETKTEYDKEGYNKEGFNELGWNKIGMNRETNSIYDKEGYNINGWNNEFLNKETKTEYDKEGYNINGFNVKGINKETKTIFDREGNTLYLKMKELNLRYSNSSFPSLNSGNIIVPQELRYVYYEDDFDGTTWKSNHFKVKKGFLALTESTLITSKKVAYLRKNQEDYLNYEKDRIEFLQALKDTISIDIQSQLSLSNELTSHVIFGIFTLEKVNTVDEISILLASSKIITIKNIENVISKRQIIDYGTSLMQPRHLNTYSNEIYVFFTKELFDLFSRLEKDEVIKIRLTINNEKHDIVYKNNFTEKEGIYIPLMKYYELSSNKKNK